MPAERLGVEDRREEDRREEDRRTPFPLVLSGNAPSDEALNALVGFHPQREDWCRPFQVYLMGSGVGDENLFEAEHADEPEVETVLGFRPAHAVNVSAGCNGGIDRVATACGPGTCAVQPTVRAARRDDRPGADAGPRGSRHAAGERGLCPPATTWPRGRARSWPVVDVGGWGGRCRGVSRVLAGASPTERPSARSSP
ncbi:DUF6368 family protein [Streptomyces antibioticus]|uniref:DUF6368 family protein n=1 Tax=Streptomyces antibioticus TaxID=1890 RepID=UPI00338FCF3C